MPESVFGLAIAAFLFFTHRSNIAKAMLPSERRSPRKRRVRHRHGDRVPRAGHACGLGSRPRIHRARSRDARNPRYLPETVRARTRFASAPTRRALAGADVVLVGVPTQHMREVVPVCATPPAGVRLVSLARGSSRRPACGRARCCTRVVGGARTVLVLSGPSHAEEVALGLPAAVVLAGRRGRRARCRMRCAVDDFRIYRQTDLLGVELCGALKNVMALAAGMADGLGYGDNAKAAILSRGIVEMARYGIAEGAELRTFYGIAGVGDLAVTAFSRHGRNRAFGERIGKGEIAGRDPGLDRARLPRASGRRAWCARAPSRSGSRCRSPTRSARFCSRRGARDRGAGADGARSEGRVERQP